MTHRHPCSRRSSSSLVVLCFALATLSSAAARAQDEITFTTFGGNDWWIEVFVEPAALVTEVDVSVEGRAWRALSLQDWGSWATSFFVESGSRVRFRALGEGGQIATSATYVWPSGEVTEPVEDPGTGESGSFSASFFGVAGNNWWVETYVDASAPLAAVDARGNGGPWFSLVETDWGSWGASFFVAGGSTLELRALSTTGEEVRSALYSWPDATVITTPAPEEDPGEEPAEPEAPAGTFAASFERPRGNEWWVEVNVSSTTAIAAVEARANADRWVSLERTAWGSWAASFFVPGGSLVEARALSSDGRVALSPTYAWPDGTIVSSPPPDPIEEDPVDEDPVDEDPVEEDPVDEDPPVPGISVLPFDDPRVAFLGRVDDRVEGQPACSWTGCGFIVVTDAERVEMEVEADVRNGGSDYLRVRVDGSPADVIELPDGRQRVTLASGLSSGTHTIAIYKRTEPQVGTVRFLALELDGGALRTAQAPSGPRLLVIGDSITAGYGNVGDGPFCGFTAATEDGWQSYANLTAQLFGGEALITAFSGKGVYRNRSAGDPWTMPLLYDRLDVFDAASQAPFASVDAIVINLGTNDFAASNPSEGPFVAAYAGFVADLRERFPDAPIFLGTSPMLTDDWPAGWAQRSTLRAYLEEVIATRAGAGDTDVYLVDHATQSTEGQLGCDYHPYVTTHQRMADELATALETYAGW